MQALQPCQALQVITTKLHWQRRGKKQGDATNHTATTKQQAILLENPIISICQRPNAMLLALYFLAKPQSMM
jgi:hypothetical protein